MSNILVTGGLGFIGRSLVPALTAEGHRVVLLVRSVEKPNSLIKCSQLTLHDIETSRIDMEFDAVVNLAGKYSFDHNIIGTDTLVESNVELPVRIAAALSRHSRPIRWVQASTFMQHKDSQQRNPSCFYASTKQATEDLLGYFASDRFELISLVLPHIYGARDNRPKLINLLVSAARAMTSIQLSSGKQVMDLVHVDDIVKSIQVALFSGVASGRWQVSSNSNIRIVDIVDFVNSIPGVKIDVRYNNSLDRLTDCYELWIGAPALPGWTKQIELFDWLRHELEHQA